MRELGKNRNREYTTVPKNVFQSLLNFPSSLLDISINKMDISTFLNLNRLNSSQNPSSLSDISINKMDISTFLNLNRLNSSQNISFHNGKS